LNAEVVAPFRHRVRGARIRNVLVGEEGQLQQVVGGGLGECLILGWFEGGHHVAGHAGTHDACTARGDDGTELVEEQRGADEVNGEDRFRAGLNG
jgi:hypothetical protein